MTLLEETDMAIANLLAMEPYTVANFERDKKLPNVHRFDPTVFEDDDDRWSGGE